MTATEQRQLAHRFGGEWQQCPGLQPCGRCQPRHCEFGDWGEWYGQEACNGLRFRRRSVNTTSNECGAPCSGPKVETEEFRNPDCQLDEQDCVFSDWSEWTGCGSKRDQSTRHREIASPPSGAGRSCSGGLEETKPCGGPEPVPCLLSDWRDWTECSVLGFIMLTFGSPQCPEEVQHVFFGSIGRLDYSVEFALGCCWGHVVPCFMQSSWGRSHGRAHVNAVMCEEATSPLFLLTLGLVLLLMLSFSRTCLVLYRLLRLCFRCRGASRSSPGRAGSSPEAPLLQADKAEDKTEAEVVNIAEVMGELDERARTKGFVPAGDNNNNALFVEYIFQEYATDWRLWVLLERCSSCTLPVLLCLWVFFTFGFFYYHSGHCTDGTTWKWGLSGMISFLLFVGSQSLSFGHSCVRYVLPRDCGGPEVLVDLRAVRDVPQGGLDRQHSERLITWFHDPADYFFRGEKRPRVFSRSYCSVRVGPVDKDKVLAMHYYFKSVDCAHAGNSGDFCLCRIFFLPPLSAMISSGL
ncbi:unnamed protein product [Prorocentrum cordatum]|uniref:Uncharacterized protein n=1 Tax=Prorocentrum cordatum TaxID=2364126 RepID=A0ABN9XHB4_9DINO|nr:unnamed protein product [Polarella glacialis]